MVIKCALSRHVGNTVKSSIDFQSITIFENQQIIFKDHLHFQDFHGLEFAPFKFEDFPAPGESWYDKAVKLAR